MKLNLVIKDILQREIARLTNKSRELLHHTSVISQLLINKKFFNVDYLICSFLEHQALVKSLIYNMIPKLKKNLKEVLFSVIFSDLIFNQSKVFKH